MKSILAAFFLLAVSSPASALTLSGFETPESVVTDPEDGSYFVSNVNGDPFTKDGNGYISRISANGAVVIQKFIGGRDTTLHAPKGLALVGRTLYVTDIDTVKAFDKVTRKPAALVDLSRLGVKFLNDLTVDAQGVLYVSDMLTNRIFKLDTRDDNRVSLFAEGEALGSPNGLLFNPKSKNLMVATWQTGQVLEVDRQGKAHVLKKGLKNLDGLDYDARGNIFVSSFATGEVFRISHYGRGTLSTYVSGLTTPADICYDRVKDELVVPSFDGNTVTALSRPMVKHRVD